MATAKKAAPEAPLMPPGTVPVEAPPAGDTPLVRGTGVNGPAIRDRNSHPMDHLDD